jgi:MFS family permease
MNRTFWITLFVSFANSLSFTILIPILYLYGRQFGLTDFQTSLLFATYAIAQFLSTSVIGKLSDRFGRRPLLILSLTGTVIANFLAGTASHASMLFFARFLDGITGGNVSVAQAIISDITLPDQRARAFGSFAAVTFGLGFVIGPALSLLAQQISLGTGFLVSSAIAFLALIITIFALPETLSQKTVQGNLFDLGLRNLVTGLAMPKIGILLLINFLIGTTFTIFTFAFQPYYIHVLNQNSRSITMLFITFGLLTVIVQLKGISFLTQRFSLVKILFLGLFVRSLTFLFMPLVPDLAYFVAISLVFSIFNALVQPMITTLISLNAKPEVQGMAMGLNSSYLNVSNAFGPLIAGLLIHQSDPSSYRYPLYLAGGLTFIVLGFAIATRRRYSPQSLN